MAGTSRICFLLRLSVAQGEPRKAGRGYSRGLVSYASGPQARLLGSFCHPLPPGGYFSLNPGKLGCMPGCYS
jgi:hypothetical protein